MRNDDENPISLLATRKYCPFLSLFRSLLIFLLLFHFSISKTYSDTFKIDSDLSGENDLIDLSEILDLPLVLVPVPDYLEDVPEYHLLSPSDGWAIFEDTERRLWRRKDNTWFLDQDVDKTARTLYVLSENQAWVAVDDKLTYKGNLLHFDGKKWQEVSTPNSDQIWDLCFLSATSGWAGCVWGQIMRYNSQKWNLVECPTPYHVERIIMMNDSLGYAKTDYPRNAILKYDHSRWEITLLVDKPLDKFALFSDTLAYDYRQGFINLSNGSFKDIEDLKSIRTDTLQLPFYLRKQHTVWASWQGPVRKKEGFTVTRQGGMAPNDIFYFHTEDEGSVVQNWHYQIYYMFSRLKLERAIVLKSLSRIQYSNSVRFSMDENNQSTLEHGVCVADFSGDGLEDYYVVVTNNPNRLYLNSPELNGPGYYVEVSEKAGVLGPVSLEDARANYDEGASCADIDNDGDQDLLVTSLYGCNLFYKQVRPAKFRECAQTLNINGDFNRTYLGVWGDVNNDGFIDLFVCNGDSTNHLYQNNGAGLFKDITHEAGLYVERGGSGAAFADIDNDGDLDLFVSRFGMRNLLYRNQGLKNESNIPSFVDFTYKANLAGQDTITKSSSAMFADFDNDGDFDLFVTNLVNSNWLYLNDGNGHFTDVTGTSGLQDSALSQMAVYLDVENDGDLDIYVGNRGANAYYENNGDGTFINSTLKAHTRSDGYSSGLVVFDMFEDGDLDIYIGEDANQSQTLSNFANNKNYLKILPIGTKSNRDAIGSKVYMYAQGHLGDHNFLLATQQVHGGYGHNSMSSRIVHFGIPDGQPKDLLIIFPSGIRREFYAVKPGQTIKIHEEEGWARRRSLFIKWVVRNVKYPPNQKEALFLFSFLLLVIAINAPLSRTKWWQRKIAVLSFIAPLAVFIFLYILLGNTNFFLRHFLPSAFGLGTCGIGVVVGRRFYGRELFQHEVFEKLFFATSAFFHGEWGARKLNRLQLYCSNLQSGRTPTLEIKNALTEAIGDFFQMIHPEVEKIIEYTRGAGIDPGLRSTIESNLTNIVRELTALKTDINIPNGINNAILSSSLEHVTLLQTSLRSLRKIVSEHFKSNVHDVVTHSLDAETLNGVKIKFNSQISLDVQARIAPAELSQIMENLIENAVRAMQKSVDKRIELNLACNADFVFISITDSGEGMPTEIKNEIFKHQITTKKRAGGFGLFHSKQILTKYGGDIQIVKSDMGKGTTIRLQLKRVDNV